MRIRKYRYAPYSQFVVLENPFNDPGRIDKGFQRRINMSLSNSLNQEEDGNSL